MRQRWRGLGYPPPPAPPPHGGRDGGGETNSPSRERMRVEVPQVLRATMRDAAREHRKNPTPSESLLWEALRGGKLRRKFRRQQPIGPFIVDFYCPEERLVIEVDGKIHDGQQREDAERQAALESLDLRFLRVSHDDVIFDLASVLERIRREFTSSAPLPPPSPLVGEGLGVGGGETRR